MPRKRTPIEQVIAEQKDRRARYEANRRRAGFVRCNLWIDEKLVGAVRAMVAETHSMTHDERAELCRQNQEALARVKAANA